MHASDAVHNAHVWFESNSGWAPPDVDTLDEWSADGVCRAPDECMTTPTGWCEHGLASWWLILDALQPDDCWGCGRERGIDGTLGSACRTQLAERRTATETPRLNEMIDTLESDVYTRLCWNCVAELSTAISGLCPVCEAELRR